MNELKFRVYDKKNKKWLDYEDFIINNGNVYEDSIDFEDGIPLEEDAYIIVRSTGESDVRGTDIYPGDLCKNQSNYLVGEVLKGQDGYFFVTKFNNEYTSERLSLARYSLIVIGNIYDNPELAEKFNV